MLPLQGTASVSFEIPSISESNAGVYRCVATNADGRDERSVELIVESGGGGGGEYLSVRAAQEYVAVREGDAAELACVATGACHVIELTQLLCS